jgi:hypothetical protein
MRLQVVIVQFSNTARSPELPQDEFAWSAGAFSV